MGLTRIKVFSEMIKFEHTVFALPFAYLGVFLAVGGFPSLAQFIWITLAMVGARTAAMSLNRLIDRHIDARNPRTEVRALPKGLIPVYQVWIYTILSFLLLYIAASQLNPLCVKLMPIAVLFLVAYSYMKRITWLCHVVLGISIGLAPVGAWVAITGTLNLTNDLAAILLGTAVTFWVAGFDVIYACQDYEFDRKEGLHSIPARFGLVGALRIARLFHAMVPVFLFLVAVVLKLGFFYLAGVVVATVILFYEHSLVRADDLSRLDTAFFNMNGILSVVMFLFTLAEIIYPTSLF
ncbi:MAG: putative 4-hydroxybenzoate polyprenyltransferase [Clostridia bacterium]|nr:putative 4-hydroxybenzoate polyprenyltransferase [Clostridia bacterium]